ncbi:TetR/AcrR family transcriptional regulator [Mycobacterium vicinigordonae]|uniref:TetR/AcrR family transcriptional regulator n=1 Tax=Mycobacterium vicinigordonae TaxID=1719132 RepID=A0A7D6E4L7_9MYCO|nr:TetR/AcrR family transcriptional regulator [Mycobacterium vicinigordonae]QLL06663.1 TetR/AcrR family transcriptional regulator [Mycobacterium vicinigordonae]
MASTRSWDALVQATLLLIAETGVDSLTLSQVAEQAGVSRATAYREFGDKDGLVSAVAQHEIQQMALDVMTGADSHADPATLVPTTVLAALRYLRNHAAFTYVRDHEPHWLLQAVLRVGEARMNVVQTVAATIAPAIAATEYPHPVLPPLQTAEIIVRTVLSHTLIERSALTDEEVAASVARAITVG